MEMLREGNNTRFEKMEEQTVETKQEVRNLENMVRQNQDAITQEVGEVQHFANRLDEQIKINKNSIMEIDQREKNLQERLEALRDTPILNRCV